MPWHRTAVLVLALLATSEARAVRELSGTTPSGAAFAIVAPDGWRAGDPLLYWNHGFDFEPVTQASLGPLRELALSQGYAVAASGYRQRGWALFTALDDNAELLARFRAQFGEPGVVIAAGGSMGGLISLKQAEDERFSVDGVLALCPAAAGARTWDRALDLRLTYDAICSGVSEGDLPTGAQPLPWALDLDDIPDDLGDLTQAEPVLRAMRGVTVCLGLYLPESIRLPSQRQRLARLMQLARIDSEEALETQLAYALFALSDLVRAPDKLAGRNPFASEGVAYPAPAGDPGLPERYARFAADPIARARFASVSSLAGTGEARRLALHTSRDPVVPAESLAFVSGRAVVAVASEATPTHCGFSNAEFAAGWESLRAWMRGTPAPTIASLNAACAQLAPQVGGGACRFDAPATQAALSPASVAAVFLPRPVLDAGFTQPALWYDPATPGQGFLLQPGPQGAVLSWYTHPPAGSSDAQRWILGTAPVLGEGLHVRDAVDARANDFGPRLDPARVERVPFGEIVLASSGPDRAVLEYDGGARYGRGRIELARLSKPDGSTPATPGFRTMEGAFFEPARSGNGVFVHAVADARAPGGERVFVLWFDYDPQGRPIWLFGEGERLPDGASRFALVQPVGGVFGGALAPTAFRAWGAATITALACDRIRLQWTTTQPGYGDGERTLERLTRPSGACTP